MNAISSMSSTTLSDDLKLLRAFTLCVMRTIAKRHEGYIVVHEDSHSVDFIVPESEELDVIKEVMEQVGGFVL